MKILYVATDQKVPGATGGSVHVLEVARGLARRGHEVHAVVAADGGAPLEQEGGVVWHRVSWRPRHRLFRFRARPAVEAIAGALRPAVVMERYYNFGGEGITAAARLGIPSLLEVNSPVVDHAGSVKGALDAALLVRPLRRYREGLCRSAAALVAPILEIVPAFARSKTETVTWGANVDTFSPAERREEMRRELGVPEGAVVVVFTGSFRPWHGIHVLEEAARRLRARADIYFVLAGGAAEGAGDGYHGRRLGTRPYAAMPAIVAAGDMGVAPYDPSRLAQLTLGFYWSPLKIFEYMASGLPTITIPRAPLTEIVREGQEGLHTREGDAAALADAIVRLAEDAGLRKRMGARARERVVERYSWARHCEQLEGVLRRIAA
ncbi:MAG TPA: glycosyltransferase [Vicinamibacteria bacterium]|nr:glycosyltransferase [Vicinamibacteria bacterium]